MRGIKAKLRESTNRLQMCVSTLCASTPRPPVESRRRLAWNRRSVSSCVSVPKRTRLSDRGCSYGAYDLLQNDHINGISEAELSKV